MCLKILHPEGPNHEPELNGAKAPTQGDLPVLGTNNTGLMVRSKVPSPLGALSIMRCLPSPPGTHGVAMTPKAVAKEQTKTSYHGGTPQRAGQLEIKPVTWNRGWRLTSTAA